MIHKATKLLWETNPVEAATEEWAHAVGQMDAAKERLQRANDESRAATANFQVAHKASVERAAVLIAVRQAKEFA